MTTKLQQRVKTALARLHETAAQVGRPMTFMEVCGTHTMSAFRSGLHSLMPDNVRLLSGPGCPVCVTAQGDIDLLIQLAMDRDVTLCTYGDMLRVPGAQGSLEKARSQGADVRVVYSTMDAVKLAQAKPNRQVVFGAVGFETTAPASAIAVLEAEARGLDNFSILASHKLVVPAMLALLAAEAASDQPMALDGFLCPGHVSIVIGANAYEPIIRDYQVPCVIGGFEEMLMAEALAALAQQVRDGEAKLVNQYPEAVWPAGNKVALASIDFAFQTVDARWRGLGVIPDSGLELRPSLAAFDAKQKFALTTPEDREPKGCICGEVISGKADPTACKLFAKACTPINPIGPCMVSSEGTCQAWFKYARGRQGSANKTAADASLTVKGGAA